ncbi:MAG: quinone-dependent dihydroorotate dehydrogenase [Acidobacteria bacterium]|nr:quinone-dependent dihydroorotate dehydrogenase [Acidobacteriota bacterium]
MLYTRVIRPLLFTLDPELSHRSAIRFGRWLSGLSVAHGLLRRAYDIQFQELSVEAFGLGFRNPVGLAAGFDKHGEICALMPRLGFGHVEVGSVSLRPWPGNPSPTLLRLPRDHGLINRLGLNSEGSEVVQARLQNMKFEIPTGVSLVKTADPAISGGEAIEDYLENFARFYDRADFITLNLSCPNTVDGRTFEDPQALEPFLNALRLEEVKLKAGSRAKPVLIKLSPDLDDETLDRVLALAERSGISGYVIANTTARREDLKTPAPVLAGFGTGGLSGLPLTRYARAMVRKVWTRTRGRRPIIACGGIGCDPRRHPAEAVWEYLTLGATLVQLHTGLIYCGPSIVRLINEELVRILRRNGFSSLAEFFQKRKEQLTQSEGGG